MSRTMLAAAVNWLWRSLLVPLVGESDAIDATFHDALRHYLEPGRHYHTIEHVHDVSSKVMTLADVGADDLTALNLAAILHDVIYDSRAKDNEERSAEYAHEV